IAPAIHHARSRALSDYGLHERDHHDPASADAAPIRALDVASALVDVPEMPLLFVRPEANVRFASIRSAPPATVIGAQALGGITSADLWFAAARHMTYYRPENHAYALCNSAGELAT